MKKIRITNDKVQIDKAVPVPNRKGIGQRKYPWEEMEVGDSFLVDAASGKINSGLLYARYKFAPRKFISRKTPEGTRVWRTE